LPTVDWVEVVVGVVVSVAWITPIMLAWFQVNYALSPPGDPLKGSQHHMWHTYTALQSVSSTHPHEEVE
jgi:hypothetical protein